MNTTRFKLLLTTVLIAGMNLFAKAGIHEDWVWEYRGAYGTFHPLDIHYFMRFDGVQNRGDIEYHKFIVSECRWFDNDSKELIKCFIPDVVYYIRESDGVYYALIKDGDLIRQSQSREELDKDDVTEVQLYDYNVAGGASWHLPWIWDKGGNDTIEFRDFIVWRINKVTVANEKLRAFRCEGIKFVESVGPLSNGHLAEPTLAEFSGFASTGQDYPWIQSYLLRIKDNDGNVLYEDPESSGVEPIAEEADNSSAAVYDLCGRTVLTDAAESDLRNLPKGIYIYKGRKIII